MSRICSLISSDSFNKNYNPKTQCLPVLMLKLVSVGICIDRVGLLKQLPKLNHKLISNNKVRRKYSLTESSINWSSFPFACHKTMRTGFSLLKKKAISFQNVYKSAMIFKSTLCEELWHLDFQNTFCVVEKILKRPSALRKVLRV